MSFYESIILNESIVNYLSTISLNMKENNI